ncbi:hypothetical protein ACS0TY_000385 [Phlomoides rotata]
MFHEKHTELFLPSSSNKQVHVEYTREENYRSTRNDEDMGSVFSDHRLCANDHFLTHIPSLQVSRETHGTFSPPSSMKRVSSKYSSPAFMTPNMQRTNAQVSPLQDLWNFSQQELENDLLKSGMAVNDHDREFRKLRYRLIQIQ